MGRGWLGAIAAAAAWVLLAGCAGGSTAGSAPAGAPPHAAQGSSQPADAPPLKVESMKTAYTTASASMAHQWVAVEAGYFLREGLDVEVSFIGPGQPVLGALSSGEVPIAMAGANQAIEANLRGGDYLVVGGGVGVVTNSVYCHPSIQRPEDLRGKTIGVSNFGAMSHIGVKLALAKYGLKEGSDVAVVRSGGTPESLAAMDTGAVDCAVFSAPQTFTARDMGYREVVDNSALGIDFQSAAVLTTRRFARERPDLVERYLKGLIRGVYRSKTDRDYAVEVMVKYTSADDIRQQRETWNFIKDKMQSDLVPTMKAIEVNLNLIRESGAFGPEAMTAKPEDFVDLSFVRKIKASGFVEQVAAGR